MSRIWQDMMEMEGKNKKPHRRLVAWQKGLDLAIALYNLTKNFPSQEVYGLTSQLRRAALSVPANIAEGAADRSRAQFSHFLSNALGSLNEIDTQLELSFRLGYIAESDYRQINALVDECLAITYGLRKSLLTKEKK